MEHQNTEIITAIIAATILFVLFAGFIITFLFFYNKKKRLHYTQLKEQQMVFEQETLRSQLEIKEQTLHYIAQEIHDNVGQVMSLAALNLNKILMTGANEIIEDTRNLLDQSISDLRDISRSLHSEQVASLDIDIAIERELGRLKKTGLVTTSLNIEGDVLKIEPAKKLILFRMVQEILQNIMKHAKSTHVNINLCFQNEFLILDIEDNGIGFNADETLKRNNNEKGAGLLNLLNRSKALNAKTVIKSRPGEGTCINIELPLYSNVNATSNAIGKGSIGG
jgi:two-component system NarL family sensor kinase